MTAEEFRKENKEIFDKHRELLEQEKTKHLQSFVGKFFKEYEDFGCFWKYYHITKVKGSGYYYFTTEVTNSSIGVLENKVEDVKKMKEITKEEYIKQLELLAEKISDFKSTLDVFKEL